MRFSVRWLDVCAGEEKRILRKGAFCGRDVTERRSVRDRPHAVLASFGEVCRQNALFRYVAHPECAFP